MKTAGFTSGSVVKNTMQETQFWSLGREDPLEKEMATHSCLGNPMDRGGCLATVHGVAKSWAWVTDVRTTKEKRIKVSLISLHNHNSEVMVPDIFPGSQSLVPVNADSPKLLPPLKITPASLCCASGLSPGPTYCHESLLWGQQDPHWGLPVLSG